MCGIISDRHFKHVKPVSHRTRLGTRFQYGILVDWYEYSAPTVPGDDSINSIKQGLSRFEHDLQNDFHSNVVRFQVRSSTV